MGNAIKMRDIECIGKNDSNFFCATAVVLNSHCDKLAIGAVLRKVDELVECVTNRSQNRSGLYTRGTERL